MMAENENYFKYKIKIDLLYNIEKLYFVLL